MVISIFGMCVVFSWTVTTSRLCVLFVINVTLEYLTIFQGRVSVDDGGIVAENAIDGNQVFVCRRSPSNITSQSNTKISFRMN